MASPLAPDAAGSPRPLPCGLGEPCQAVSWPARPGPGELGAGRGRGRPAPPPTFLWRGCRGRGLGDSFIGGSRGWRPGIRSQGPGNRGPGDDAPLGPEAGVRAGDRGSGPGDSAPRGWMTSFPGAGRTHCGRLRLAVLPPPRRRASTRGPASARRRSSCLVSIDGGRQADATSPEASMAAGTRALGGLRQLFLRLRTRARPEERPWRPGGAAAVRRRPTQGRGFETRPWRSPFWGPEQALSSSLWE